jgi:DNA mismatch endonuclease (patch repair protein)
MADSVSKAHRSLIMAAVKSKNTTPELKVRRLVHRLGYRFRLHVRSLPGSPDIVLPRLHKIIEVHGCFWHGHDCGRCRIPQTHRDYWLAKIERNRRRGYSTIRKLNSDGWSVLVVWECEIQQVELLKKRLKTFLASPKPKSRRI